MTGTTSEILGSVVAGGPIHDPTGLQGAMMDSGEPLETAMRDETASWPHRRSRLTLSRDAITTMPAWWTDGRLVDVWWTDGRSATGC